MNIPENLTIIVRQSMHETTLIPVRDVLAVPATAAPIWDGPEHPAQMPSPPFIWFGVGWHMDFAGAGYEDTCLMAAQIAAHLAAMQGGWPSGEVHVRGLPVVDMMFDFVAAPQRIEPDEVSAEQLRAFTAGLEGA